MGVQWSLNFSLKAAIVHPWPYFTHKEIGSQRIYGTRAIHYNLHYIDTDIERQGQTMSKQRRKILSVFYVK